MFAQSRTQAAWVIGTPGEDVGTIADAGAFSYLPIGTDGPDPRSARTITADTADVQGKAGRGSSWVAARGDGVGHHDPVLTPERS